MRRGCEGSARPHLVQRRAHLRPRSAPPPPRRPLRPELCLSTVRPILASWYDLLRGSPHQPCCIPPPPIAAGPVRFECCPGSAHHFMASPGCTSDRHIAFRCDAHFFIFTSSSLGIAHPRYVCVLHSSSSQISSRMQASALRYFGLIAKDPRGRLPHHRLQHRLADGRARCSTGLPHHVQPSLWA